MKTTLTSTLKPLYCTASLLCIAMLAMIPLQILLFLLSPPPSSVGGFFVLFQRSPLLGLLSLDFLYLFNNLIVAVLYLALFFLFFHEKPVTVLLALFFGVIGVCCYYSSNPAFEMWTLSSKYAMALPQEKLLYLSAGEGLMAGYAGTSFNTYYVLSTLSLLLFSTVLMKSPQVGRVLGLSGLLSGIFMIIPSSAGTLGLIFSLLSLIPWMVFVTALIPFFRLKGKG